MDNHIWTSYALSAIMLAVVMVFIGTFTMKKKRIDVTEDILRMAFGWLEPYEIKWHNNHLSASTLITMWLLFSVSFNMFYNVEFRSSLMTQKFPPDIDHMAQVDIFKSGLYYDKEVYSKIVTA